VAQTGVTLGDCVGAVVEGETVRQMGWRQVRWSGGLRFGSALGVVAGLVLPYLIILSSIPET
jgi:hypothetical protein